MAREGDVLLEQDVNEEIISKLDDIYKSLEEHLTLEANKNEEVVNELKKINDFLVEQKEQQEEEELLAEQERLETEDLQEEEKYEEILVSIDSNLYQANNYMYTLNVYMAGFLVIIMLYLLTKVLIGFFKPFL